MMDPFSAQPPPARIVPQAMAEPSYYHHLPTMLGFPPSFAPAPFAQGAMPPPVLVPMQTTSVEPAYYYPQAQGAAASAGEEAATAHEVPDTQKAQEATTPTPRRRGRPRKTAAAASKPVFKAPKRATARSNRAALQLTTSVTNDLLATMAGQVQVQKPEQAASVAAASTSDAAQTAPCRNPTPLLCQEQWRPQSTCSNSLSAGGQAAAVVVGQQQEVMLLPYAYAETSAAGVRFRPTDEDLIFFLRLKHAGREIPVGFFKDFDVYQASPEACKAACGVVDDDGCWYAFSPRDRKYKNGARPKRSVVDESDRQLGYWKSNTKLAYVVTSGKDEGAAIGNVTSLTFHVGHQPRGTQTPWKMKEYAIPENQHAPDGSVMRLNDWVVCKLFYKERVIAAGKKKRVIAAGKKEDQSGEDGKNVGEAAGGDEGTQMVPADQTLGDFDHDLCVEDYPGYDDACAEQNHAANGNILHRRSS
ncbi:hypothetical protein GQ55_9G036500 [Panicum hallii var. hallii]|uniref:NAC domain-containing protein n=1 Tax=Panicum hallii var. hallii TaxID=1504633 RepID=A0A2T7BZ94_9POAL|nr:hypothetical protein GQ55_9G036500 [Panicum hallii var. hallii]